MSQDHAAGPRGVRRQGVYEAVGRTAVADGDPQSVRAEAGKGVSAADRVAQGAQPQPDPGPVRQAQQQEGARRGVTRDLHAGHAAPQPLHQVRALARIRAESDGRGGTALPLLAGDGPLALRQTRAYGRPGAAAVTVVGAMTAPLGGDRLRIEAEAGGGAQLVVGAAAATVALPGHGAGDAAYDVRLTVRDGGALDWLPEPLIAARGCALRTTTRVDLAPTARLLLREEQILGRYAEEPGRLTARLTVRRAGRPLLDQELSFGPGIPDPLGGYRAAGQLLVVDPRFAGAPARPRTWTGDVPAALTPLAGPAVLISAVAPDGLRLRRALDQALAVLGGCGSACADSAAGLRGDAR